MTAYTALPSGCDPGSSCSGRPLIGSSAARPGRGTAPGPAKSLPLGLLFHRWWPPTKTAVSVIATPHMVSPPASFTQVGWMSDPRSLVLNRAVASHSVPATPPPVELTTK